MSQAPFTMQGHNPDVLTCIANLSNDEVFTPPELANQMLDVLEHTWATENDGESIWKDKEATFLDPCTKSGVFLREIVRRLNQGLSDQIPDLSERINHILTRQVFGIGITELTALLARRSVYCSKFANGIHSIARTFGNVDGNIWFQRTDHTWANQKCKFCGASKAEYARGTELESHAYAFIHNEDVSANLSEMFGATVHFDVIIGNPPYQLSTGGTGGAGVQARPIYNAFVDQAKSLDPRYLCMVTPSRWFSGGMGLDSFRESMLNDNRLRIIHDFPDSNDVFPGTQIKGGVSFFLWDRDNRGEVSVTTHDKGALLPTATRPLLEPGCDVFIRYNEGVSILRKVLKAEANDPKIDPTLPSEKQFMGLVSSIGSFGLDTTFRGKDKPGPTDVMVYRNGGVGYINRLELTKGTEAIDWWKVFVPAAGSGSDGFPHSILGKPFVGAPGSASSWTYMHIGPFKNRTQAANAASYVATRFFRFLVLLHKPTQHATRTVYTFVPKQDFAVEWTDERLYNKYGISENEIAFIESMIRPMELGNE
ncbi:Restriction modification methylase Eco57I [Acidimicrobiia bacterium]